MERFVRKFELMKEEGKKRYNKFDKKGKKCISKRQTKL